MWELGGELPPRGRYPDYVRTRLLDEGLLAALDRIRDASRSLQVAVASYISLPNSAEVVNLLRLGLCDWDPVGHCQRHCRALVPGDRRCDAAHSLTDRVIFERTLAPGQRSAVFASRSPVARDAYGVHRVHFFYVNVDEEIGRVEVPAWVAEERGAAVADARACRRQRSTGGGLPRRAAGGARAGGRHGRGPGSLQKHGGTRIGGAWVAGVHFPEAAF